KLNVDLHWRIVRWQAFKSDFLWSRAVTVRSGEIQSLWLAPEELFLYLCIHLDKSPGYQLKWILDIALVLVRHPTMNWERVQELAYGTGNKRTILRVLCVVDRILGVSVPQKLSREVHAYPRNTAYASLVMGQLFRDDQRLPGFREWCRYMEMLRFKGTSAKLNWLPLRPLFQYLRVVMDHRLVEWKAVKLLRSFSCPYWLYQSLQPLRLVWQHTSRLLKRIRSQDRKK
ncbi:nucleotidyltransferase family protein, partial [bacterium]|nr:nucleotidyltransferase family protein [bacterium]